MRCPDEIKRPDYYTGVDPDFLGVRLFPLESLAGGGGGGGGGDIGLGMLA